MFLNTPPNLLATFEAGPAVDCPSFVRRGRDVDIPRRRVAAPPRLATWTFRGDESRRRRGRQLDSPIAAELLEETTIVFDDVCSVGLLASSS